MLQECSEHGFFRDKECPICGEEGKFIMDEGELDHIGRTLAGVLRHFPEKFRLDMDEHGWVSITDFIRAMQNRERQLHWLRDHHVHAIIETDPKERYQIKNDLMRATYGHSLDLDLDLPTIDIPGELFYPATVEEVDILLEAGLKPSDRKWVHLSKTMEAAQEAGSHRTDEPIIIKIDSAKAIEDGHVIMRAGTTVYITEMVNPEYLEKLQSTPKAEVVEEIEPETKEDPVEIEKVEKVVAPKKTEKAVKADKPVKAEKVVKPKKTEKAVKADKPVKAEKVVKPKKTEKAVKADKPVKAEKVVKPKKTE